MRAAFFLPILVACVLAVTASAAVAPSGPPTSIGTGGAAASVETLATQAAIDTLRAGGNAVDAAVAAAGVLGVTEPFSCGVGGGGFMVIRTAAGKVTTIDGRETAPVAMTPTSFWENGAPLPFNDARWSGMSVGVPGTRATWEKALDEVRDDVARAGAAAGHRAWRVTASWSTRRSSIRRTGRSRGSTTSRDGGAVSSIPTARRTTSARSSATPTSRDVRADRAARREGPLPRRDRGRDGRHGPASRRRADAPTTSGGRA